MDRALLETGSLGIIGEELLHLALLQGLLAAGEQIRPDISALTQIAANEFGRVPPQGLFAAEAIFQAADRDPMVLKVHSVDGEHQGFAHAQAVVIDETKEGPVTRRRDRREEACELILGQVFGEGSHRSSIASFAYKV